MAVIFRGPGEGCGKTLHCIQKWSLRKVEGRKAYAECGQLQGFCNSTMIRRPLTEIVLKLDDLQEYEAIRRDQGSNSSSTEMQEDTTKPLTAGPKTQEEIHNRIGYAPKKKSRGPSTV